MTTDDAEDPADDPDAVTYDSESSRYDLYECPDCDNVVLALGRDEPPMSCHDRPMERVTDVEMSVQPPDVKQVLLDAFGLPKAGLDICLCVIGEGPLSAKEVADEFTDRYTDRFTVHTGYTATAASATEGRVTVEAHPYEYGEEDGIVDGESVTVTGDELLVAAGRRPNTDLLDLEATGVETDDRGFVETDDYLRTTADGVWALGDIVGEYLLKHSANHEAQAVGWNIFGDDLEPVDYTAMPFAVFASPEVAGVGRREEELRDADREYATRTYRYEETARGSAMQATGFVKVIIDLDGEILGCHIVGPEASNLIQEVVVAMKAGSGTVQDIRESVHIHPALSEVVQRAFSGQFSRAGGDHDHSHSH